MLCLCRCMHAFMFIIFGILFIKILACDCTLSQVAWQVVCYGDSRTTLPVFYLIGTSTTTCTPCLLGVLCLRFCLPFLRSLRNAVPCTYTYAVSLHIPHVVVHELFLFSRGSSDQPTVLPTRKLCPAVFLSLR